MHSGTENSNAAPIRVNIKVNIGNDEGSPKFESPRFGTYNSPFSEEEKCKIWNESKFQRSLRSPAFSDQHVLHEVFQVKQGRYMDLPASKISELMKSNNLDNAPTQSLISVINGILDESVERMNTEIPHRVVCLLRKFVQQIERRISTQADQLRTQNNLLKAREDKYQSRLRVLEALASTNEESEIATNQLQIMKNEKLDNVEQQKTDETVKRLMNEKEKSDKEISRLNQELDITKKGYELRCSELEAEAKDTKLKLEEQLQELGNLFDESKNKVNELEADIQTKHENWTKKENTYQSFMEVQVNSLKELRLSSDSVKQEIQKAKQNYAEEFNNLGGNLKAVVDAAQNHRSVLAENQKMFNELQELKGNIRVFCRVRPFIPGQKEIKTIVENINENGELVIANPTKPGKEGQRLFKFNKVFGPVSTQADVFSDIQPLIRSVLDGYNVCIFAYGQTGSGKTYTMTGPNGATEDNWGVNYRALSDLFRISQSRRNTIEYVIGVQMVEIYNEQVRDLLANDGLPKKIGIMTHSPPNGLAVPDAAMHPVNSTSDVMDLMEVGFNNRSVGATAMNERSSRSHSCVTIHVRGVDSKTGSSSHGNLHLVDLAGSERVDRSEVTGDRLKEAQHINKSLSALGDVIFALSQKSPHVPYRNSKLTQVLQSSLGGQAKTLMFVQLNPDSNSYSESLSTLKFAERVSGVELGAAKSNKEGRDVKDLVEQVASLKNTIAKKDEELELLKELKIGSSSPLRRVISPSPSRESMASTPRKSPKLSSNDTGQKKPADERHDPEMLSVGDNADCEDNSDGDLSVGTELTDGTVEDAVLAEEERTNPISPRPETVSSRTSLSSRKTEQTGSTTSKSKGSLKVSSGIKKASRTNSMSPKPPSSRKWQ